jgi:hypothetical protein
MTSTLALALRLRDLDDDDVRSIITARTVDPRHITDLFDLAEALLSPNSIQSALARLDRTTLAAAAALASSASPATIPEIADRLGEWGAPRQQLDTHLERLARLLLIEQTAGRFQMYKAVRTRLAAWPDEGLPSGPELASATPPEPSAEVPDAADRSVDQQATERAFAAVGAMAALLTELAHEPARELQKGGIALPDLRRLGAATGLNAEAVSVAVWCARKCALVARDGSTWATTDAAAEWSPLPTRKRWAALAGAWLESMPPEVRGLFTSRAHGNWADDLRSFARWFYPADTKTIQRRIDTFGTAAGFLGIAVGTAPSRAGVALLEDGIEAASGVIAALLPREIDQVYLQHDLSIVSPGPLVPEIDARLRTFADLESRALASTFRVSAASITRAIAAGESVDSLRTFLEQISLTGIPQPLDYLLSETAARYGLVRVSAARPAPDADAFGIRSRIRSVDGALLDAIEIDQTLSPLGLTRTAAHELASAFERDIVFWALTDARYPAAAESLDGQIVGVRRHTVAARSPRRVPDRIDALVARLRESDPPDSESTVQAWLSRQLDAAIHSRTTLIVTVASPDGGERDYTLEPTGIGGGRLRGRDRNTDIERTLPLSSIRSIRAHEG